MRLISLGFLDLTPISSTDALFLSVLLLLFFLYYIAKPEEVEQIVAERMKAAIAKELPNATSLTPEEAERLPHEAYITARLYFLCLFIVSNTNEKLCVVDQRFLSKEPKYSRH